MTTQKVRFGMEAEWRDGQIVEVNVIGAQNADGETLSLMSDLFDEEEKKKTGAWPYQRLKEWGESGGITVGGKPYAAKHGPASTDLAISPVMQRPRWYWRNPLTRWLLWHLMPRKRRNIKADSNELFYWTDRTIFDTLTIWPGEFILLSTVETVSIPVDAFGITRLKSTSGRSGLEQMDAGLLDPGFVGTVTLEFFNAAPWPLEISSREHYVQLAMIDLSEATDRPYAGRYQNQGVGPVTAREEVFYG